MKNLRVFILVLLAVLLPIRGAVAAAMLCPDGEATDAVVVVAGHGEHALHADRDMHADPSATHHHDTADTTRDGTPSDEHPASCHFCPSACCTAALIGQVPTLGEPGLTSFVAFPALTAPVSAFQSDGQERPPRTL